VGARRRRIGGIEAVWIVVGVGLAALYLGSLSRRSPSNEAGVHHAMWALHQRQSDYYRAPGPDGTPRRAHWTSDVMGLLRDEPPRLAGLAQADTTRGPAVPYHGYYFRALPPGADAYAICAYPAEHGKTGTLTYFINGTGLFSKDLGGRLLGPGEFVRDGSWGVID
jgi:hypothetical protein